MKRIRSQHNKCHCSYCQKKEKFINVNRVVSTYRRTELMPRTVKLNHLCISLTLLLFNLTRRD